MNNQETLQYHTQSLQNLGCTDIAKAINDLVEENKQLKRIEDLRKTYTHTLYTKCEKYEKALKEIEQFTSGNYESLDPQIKQEIYTKAVDALYS